MPKPINRKAIAAPLATLAPVKARPLLAVVVVEQVRLKVPVDAPGVPEPVAFTVLVPHTAATLVGSLTESTVVDSTVITAVTAPLTAVLAGTVVPLTVTVTVAPLRKPPHRARVTVWPTTAVPALTLPGTQETVVVVPGG